MAPDHDDDRADGKLAKQPGHTVSVVRAGPPRVIRLGRQAAVDVSNLEAGQADALEARAAALAIDADARARRLADDGAAQADGLRTLIAAADEAAVIGAAAEATSRKRDRLGEVVFTIKNRQALADERGARQAAIVGSQTWIVLAALAVVLIVLVVALRH
jgi:hypothetical protein